MGTRADFYIGEGQEAEWIASIAWDGYPEGISDAVLAATNAKEFMEALADFLDDRDDVTLPENGWPWPWEDSCTTDYAYGLFDSRVYANCFGNGWFDPVAPVSDDDERTIIRESDFPDMGKECSAKVGSKQSGLILVSA